tara:strand:- start:782 stop:1117 length:336 start_codon:yes stop_codon:yes gene_type:complete
MSKEKSCDTTDYSNLNINDFLATYFDKSKEERKKELFNILIKLSFLENERCEFIKSQKKMIEDIEKYEKINLNLLKRIENKSEDHSRCKFNFGLFQIATAALGTCIYFYFK